MKAVLAAIIALAVAGPAFANDQFDLLCVGTMQERPTGPALPITERFSFDVVAGRYCRSTSYQGRTFNDPCRDVLTIQEVTPDRITLISEDEDSEFFYINRQDGTFVNFSRSPFTNERGTCEVVEHRPLPTPRF